MISKEAVIFDFDGTLVDTLPTVLSIINSLRNDLHKTSLHRNDVVSLISLGGNALIKNSLQLDESEVEGFLGSFRAAYLEDELNLDCCYPGVHATLEKLIELGKRLYICSNKPRILLEKSLLKHKLNHFFDSIIAGDDVDFRKPDAKVLQKIVLLGESANKSLLVGDSSQDRLLAMNFGADFYFFQGGYNDDHGANDALSFADYSAFNYDLLLGTE